MGNDETPQCKYATMWSYWLFWVFSPDLKQKHFFSNFIWNHTRYYFIKFKFTSWQILPPQINKYNLPSIPFDIIFHSMSRQLPAWWLYVAVLFWRFSLCTQRFHHKPGVAPKSNQAVVGALCATRGVWYDKGSTQPDFSLY